MTSSTCNARLVGFERAQIPRCAGRIFQLAPHFSIALHCGLKIAIKLKRFKKTQHPCGTEVDLDTWSSWSPLKSCLSLEDDSEQLDVFTTWTPRLHCHALYSYRLSWLWVWWSDTVRVQLLTLDSRHLVEDNCAYLQGRGAANNNNNNNNNNNSFLAFREKNTQPFIYSVYLWIMKYYLHIFKEINMYINIYIYWLLYHHLPYFIDSDHIPVA